MGASSSPAESGIIYRAHERRFLHHRRLWQRLGLARIASWGIPLRKLFFAARIADDGLMGSSVLCPSCVSRVGQLTYPAPLVHKSEEHGDAASVARGGRVVARDQRRYALAPLKLLLTALKLDAQLSDIGVSRTGR